jgi:hypothetical protein
MPFAAEIPGGVWVADAPPWVEPVLDGLAVVVPA